MIGLCGITMYLSNNDSFKKKIGAGGGIIDVHVSYYSKNNIDINPCWINAQLISYFLY